MSGPNSSLLEHITGIELGIPEDKDERHQWCKDQTSKWITWLDGNLFQNWTLEEARCDNCQCLSLTVVNTVGTPMHLCLDLCLATKVAIYPTGTALSTSPEEMITQHYTSPLSSLISAYFGRLKRAYTSLSPMTGEEKSSSTASSQDQTKTTQASSLPSPSPNSDLSSRKLPVFSIPTKSNSAGLTAKRRPSKTTTEKTDASVPDPTQ